jgi:hypothetical protein
MTQRAESSSALWLEIVIILQVNVSEISGANCHDLHEKCLLRRGPSNLHLVSFSNTGCYYRTARRKVGASNPVLFALNVNLPETGKIFRSN